MKNTLSPSSNVDHSPVITEIEQNVDLIEFKDRKYYIIGTAHVSKSSADLVEKTIKEYNPDTVCLELDEQRFKSLKNPSKWKDTNLFDVIKSGKAYFLMAQLALASFQKKIANKLGVKPGEEMMRGISIAEETGSKIHLVDRDIKITLKRAWHSARTWSLVKMFFSFLFSLFSSEEMDEEQIEKLKEYDALTSAINEFSEYLPGIKTALLDERDLYLSKKILDCPGNNVVAVVGAGHVPGIKKSFATEIDLEKLEVIPKGKSIFKIIAWAIPAIILAMFAYGFFKAGSDTTVDMFSAWFLANGILSALGAVIALAHPVTILVAFIAAPFTSLNPMIAAGWVCGLVEVYLRKPRVKDLETISEDVLTAKGFWKKQSK